MESLTELFCQFDDFCHVFEPQWHKQLVALSEKKRQRKSGQPEKVRTAGRKSRCRRLKGPRGRGTLATEKPPILGLMER